MGNKQNKGKSSNQEKSKKTTSLGAKIANDDNSSANKISVDVRFNF